MTHIESGSSKTTESNNAGSFHIAGLRIGGPYSIEISAGNYRDFNGSDIYLEPGAQAPMHIELISASLDVPEVVATASAGAEKDLANGVGSAYSTRDIINTPSAARDILAVVNRDPLATYDGNGLLTVAGVNPRFNALSIDGSLQQDDFGLSDSTYPSERSPINLDAVESVSLVASDYSVTASNFTGGLVSLTTRSGTNEWRGSAFNYYKDEGYIGDTYDGDRSYNPGVFEEKEYGFTVGGPLMEDQLFVFLSYDMYESALFNDFSNFDSTRGIQPGFFEALRSLILDTYGVDTLGRPSTSSIPISTERTLLKFDFNATDQHRISYTYQSTVEEDTSVSSSRLQSAWNDTPIDLEAHTVQVFSDWTTNLSTNFRLNTKDYSRGQNCRAGRDVGHMDLYDISAADAVGTPLEGLITDEVSLTGGCDRFRHANSYADVRTQLHFGVDYLVGSHLFQFGWEYEHFELDNLFVPASSGRFSFYGLQDLLDKTARVDYINVTSNNKDDGAVSISIDKTTLFAQDTWYLSPNLDITYGARIELFAQDDEPVRSNAVRSQFGVDTANNLDGLRSILPRASFRYTGYENTVLSGGVGLFSGGDPKVWTSNNFAVPTVFTRLRGATNVDVRQIPQVLFDQVANATAGVPVDYIASDFEIPSDWKWSVRLEHTLTAPQLPSYLNGMTLTGQVLATFTNEGYFWTNLAHTELAETQPTGVAPDGRPIYANLDDLDLLNLTEFGNLSGGSSFIYSIAAAQDFDNGLEVSASYAYQDVEVVSEGVSSRGISNWRNITSPDRNDPSPRTSPYQVTHSLKTNLGYERSFGQFIGRVDLFSRIYSGSRFTFNFDVSSSNPLFGRAGAGESPYDNDPLYIPESRNDPRVVYASGFDVNAFFNYLDSYDLDSGIMEPFSEDIGLNQVLDLRLQLETPLRLGFLPGQGEDPVVKVIFDIENVLNFINDEWGTFETGPSFRAANIVQADLVSAADVAANGVDGATALRGDLPRTTCTSADACVYRYRDFDADRTIFTSSFRSVYEIRFGIRFDL